MQEWHDKLQLNPDGFLWLEEEKLVDHLVREQEDGLSWVEEEKGEFCQDLFPPVRIPTIPHTLWVYKKIPIPPGLYNELIKIIRDKIASGVYEPSNATYHSRWLCIIKHDESFRVVHDMYYTFNTGENFRLQHTYNTFNTYNTYDTRAPLRGFVLYHPTSVQYPALRSTMGDDQRRLHSRATGIPWVQCHHVHRRQSNQARTFHTDAHHH
jgi:hypothetical protein